MSTFSTDSSLLYDALITPRSDKTFVVGLVASVFVHAVAITLLPGIRTPQPATRVITVALERPPPPLSKVEQIPTPRQPERKVEKPFERQKLQGTPTTMEAPQPKPPDPRRDVSVAPRPEPLIEHGPEIPEPVMRPERRPLPEVQPTPQPRVERPQVVTEPSRPEPLVERRRPEPKLEERVEPQPLALEPRVASKPEQRVAPVVTPRDEPILEPQRQQTNAAPAPSRVDAASTPKLDVPTTVANVERQPEVKVEPRNEPALPTRQRPTSGPTHPAEQVAPRPEQIAERKPQAITAPPEVRPTAPTTAAAMPSAPKRNKLDVEAAIQRFAAEISRQMGKGVSERDYPSLARNRRWQGTTHLLLHISADGQLGEITVANSSGFDILDTRAIELVRRLKLPPMPADIEAHAFTVQLPVRFVLRE